METQLKTLNEMQRKAVMQLDGPVLVLAGAGSGKTKTLIFRIAYLIQERGIRPENILAVTFTNKAANEMKERLQAMIGTSSIPFIGTFHSICVRLLRRDGDHIGIGQRFNIYDQNDAIEATKIAMRQLGINIKEFSPHKIHGLISSCKSELVSANMYASLAQMPIQEVAAKVYPLYEKILKEANALDFDDLIMKTVKLFTIPEVLAAYQEQFKYILVDEYQDTNRAQYMLVRLLAQKYRNIYCVGDPDQNIYSFRGATIDNILNFETDYPDCSVIKLEQNYRSTKNILKGAHYVISKNERRKEKEMWTENSEGEKIKRYIALNEKDESYFIVQKLKLIQNYAACVVLYRTNAQSRAIEEIFLEEKIPYRLVGGLRFYDRKEIKDIIAYLKLLYNIKDNITLKRIINTPPRKIGKKTLETIESFSTMESLSEMEYLLAHKEKLSTPLQKFTSIIDYFLSLISLNDITLSHFLTIIVEKIGYIEYLQEEDDGAEMRIENIKELNSVAARYDSQDLQSAMDEFLENVALVEKDTQSGEESENQVTLMSIHSAKGLEFDYVFIVGMEEGLFPHSNSLYNQEDVEEERRLAYVGMTRAKKVLYLINAQSRVLYGMVQANPLSRFIRDIPEDYLLIDEKFSSYAPSYANASSFDVSTKKSSNPILFKKGDYVSHPTFREGVVMDIDEKNDSISIRFNSYGVKKLLLSFAKGLRRI